MSGIVEVDENDEAANDEEAEEERREAAQRNAAAAEQLRSVVDGPRTLGEVKLANKPRAYIL